METTRGFFLVVDDDAFNRQVLGAAVEGAGHIVATAENGAQALRRLRDTNFDVVLLDLVMPEIDGFELLRQMRADARLRHVPVIVISAMDDMQSVVRSIGLGATDHLTKPFNPILLHTRIDAALATKRLRDQEQALVDHMQKYQKELEAEVSRQTAQVRDAFSRLQAASLETILRLSRAAEFRDDQTGAHILRMSRYAAVVARRMGSPPDEVDRLLSAAPMHDVGKIGIPDRILLTPAKLGEDEWKVMRQHPVIGSQILAGSEAPVIRLGEEIALTHHERWDGKGYPRGLKGTEIPLLGRIVAISDVFDALTSKRPYKEAMSAEAAFRIIADSSGTHFDPDVVTAFFGATEELLEVMRTCADKPSR